MSNLNGFILDRLVTYFGFILIQVDALDAFFVTNAFGGLLHLLAQTVVLPDDDCLVMGCAHEAHLILFSLFLAGREPSDCLDRIVVSVQVGQLSSVLIPELNRVVVRAKQYSKRNKATLKTFTKPPRFSRIPLHVLVSSPDCAHPVICGDRIDGLWRWIAFNVLDFNRCFLQDTSNQSSNPLATQKTRKLKLLLS